MSKNQIPDDFHPDMQEVERLALWEKVEKDHADIVCEGICNGLSIQRIGIMLLNYTEPQRIK